MNSKTPKSNLDLHTLFPFSLDQFQQDAIAALEQGKSVVVCAPTGSGKTVIAEYAVYRAVSQGKRVFYTTPLKALSNQKFRDFQEKLGQAKLSDGKVPDSGLITGDIIINPNASVVVMTTEIFRNMLYETPIGEVGTSLEDVETVILDECHYISDRERGTVWEESIIYCPPNIQLVALSATIGNPEELTEWINQVRQAAQYQSDSISLCELINSDFRPVPLSFYFSNQHGIVPLLTGKKDKLNPQLKPKENKGRKQRIRREECPTIPQIIDQLQQKQMLPVIYVIFSRRGCDQAVNELQEFNLLTREEAQEIYLRVLYAFLGPHSIFQETQEKFLQDLEKQDNILYQKIMAFIASNPNSPEELLQYLREKSELQIELLEHIAHYFPFVKVEQLESLTRGIAAHHAGVLPAWKELIEQLFELGLIKVVFATATLSAGINMPARTTVISALSKRTDDGHSMLTPSEFLQIAGRAGRRGMDEVGNVVTIQTPFEGASEAAYLATAQPEHLKSNFAPSYGMVLNLLQKHSLNEVKDLLERSFAEYLAQLKLAPKEQVIANLTTKITKLDIELIGIDDRQVNSYTKLHERLKDEKRLLKIIHHQAQMTRKQEITPQLERLEPGAILHLKGKHVKVSDSVTAVLIGLITGSGKAADLLCLSDNNRWYIVNHSDVIDINPQAIPFREIADIDIPMIEKIPLGPWRKGDEKTSVISQKIPQYAEGLAPFPEVIEQEKRITKIETQIHDHLLQKRKNTGHLLEQYQQRKKLQDELYKIKNKYQEDQAKKSYYWDDFLNIIEILFEFKALTLPWWVEFLLRTYLVGKIEVNTLLSFLLLAHNVNPCYRLTPLGEASATLRGENELWLGLVLTSPVLEDLEPHHLAAAVSAFITEPLRPDTWTNYPPTIEVLNAFQSTDKTPISLQEIRRKLNQSQRRKVNIPVWFEDELIGVVEAWASGVKWHELCQNTSLDEGDLVRLLRRTVDVLWQIPKIPNISPVLVSKTQTVLKTMKRFPISMTDY